MSHFSVTVALTKTDSLDTILMPYHEYESTGIEEFVEWMDGTEDAQQKYSVDLAEYVQLADGTLMDKGDRSFWAPFSTDSTAPIEHVISLPEGAKIVKLTREQAGLETFEQFAKDWYGYSPIPGEPGRWGRLTNPNAKWDWWTIGGRWSGILLTTEGLLVSEANVSEINWPKMKSNEIKRAMDLYHQVQEVIADIDSTRLPIDFTGHHARYYARNEIAQRLFSNLDDYMRASWASARLHLGITLQELASLYYSDEGTYRTEYALQQAAPTFAFIDLEGKWHEKGSMGWWGMYSDAQPNYAQEYWAFIDELLALHEANPHLAINCIVVDCHI